MGAGSIDYLCVHSADLQSGGDGGFDFWEIGFYKRQETLTLLIV